MKCADVHLALGAEPHVTSPELEAHLRECAACAEFRQEMLRLDEKILRALMIDVDALKAGDLQQPTAVARNMVQKPSTRAAAGYSKGRQWALAASVLLGVALVLFMWGALPRHSLAADVVAHVISEPFDVSHDAPAVDASAVKEVMRLSNVELDPINPSIVFVRTCFFRGRFVPHFMVRTEHGVATVMIMPNEHVKAPEPFAGNGYQGLIIPAGDRGSIAVLSRSDFDPQHYAGEIRRAMRVAPTPN